MMLVVSLDLDSATERHEVAKQILYWSFTGLLVAWLFAGGVFDVAHAKGAVAILTTLGYPAYVCTILGPCKLLAVAALVFPRTLLLREWAYAGITFDMLGAFFSHLAVKDGLAATIAPLILLSFAAASYLLRPAKFRMRSSLERSAQPPSPTL
jgi:hypothetical protein